MPIYEFYCSKCHTIYSFFARSMTQIASPKCPKCGLKKLEKKISRFAISKGLTEDSSSPDPFENVDESKMEQLMAEMAPHMDEEGEGSEDPRQMAGLMKRMFELTGAQPNGAMLEAIKRMEAGEDPDKIDEEMGDALDADGDPFAPESKKSKKFARFFEPPNVDPELYDL
ncbi:MAG: zinc ribbon domain-containing protein [Pirellula sp.]